jgi:hypothetical protein
MFFALKFYLALLILATRQPQNLVFLSLAFLLITRILLKDNILVTITFPSQYRLCLN